MATPRTGQFFLEFRLPSQLSLPLLWLSLTMKRLLIITSLMVTPLIANERDRVTDTQAAVFTYAIESAMKSESIWDINKGSGMTQEEKKSFHALLIKHVNIYKELNSHDPKVLDLMNEIVEGFKVYLVNDEAPTKEFNKKWIGKETIEPAELAGGLSKRSEAIKKIIGIKN